MNFTDSTSVTDFDVNSEGVNVPFLGKQFKYYFRLKYFLAICYKVGEA